MKFTTLAIAAVLATNAYALEADTDLDTIAVEGTTGQRKLEIFRGGWLGFNKGFYKKASAAGMSKDCLDEETAQKYDDILAIYSKDEDAEGDMFTALGKAFQIGANVSQCNFRKPMRDIKKFCHPATADEMDAAMSLAKHYDDMTDDFDKEIATEMEACTFAAVLQNLSKNAFALMGKSSEAAETWKDYPAPEMEELHDQAVIIGTMCGTFARVGLNYE